MEGIIFVIALMVIFWLLLKGSRRQIKVAPPKSNYRAILEEQVPFFRRLNETGKKSFQDRMQHFLSSVRITGVHTEAKDLDRVLIAASAIIPIFAFPDWEYTNLREVLLYPDTFDEEYRIEGEERPISGMVGWGAMQNQMIISQHDLHQGFLNATGKTNTAIHEFVHLIDKTDGATDGVPENLLNQQYILPWLNLMHQKIREIRQGQSDIDPYGATNQAEFFAVASEYFFERPDLLQTKHPELFQLLETIFRQKPLSVKTQSYEG